LALRDREIVGKLGTGNPMFMRLRELEILEKIASVGHLNVVVVGEKNLADHVLKLICLTLAPGSIRSRHRSSQGLSV
jgi:hypothetical protein